MQLITIFLYFLTCLCFCEGIFDFLTKIKDAIEYNTISYVFESCDKRWVPANFIELEDDLSEKLFGQPFVIETVLSAMRSHFNNEYRRKPLVMSFHGWPGGGKSYVATFILKHMFKKGLNSKFIKRYNAKTHFPVQRNVDIYKEKLHKDLTETVAKCRHAIFVFDEVDKYPEGVLDAIKPFLDYNEEVEGYDFRQAVFLFLTNNGQHFITSQALELWKKGVHRDNFFLKDFEKALRQQSFNDEGGFYRSELIRHHLIDHYIPFLPMEKEQVNQCIDYEIVRQGGFVETLQDEKKQLSEELTFGPEGHEVYAVSGCKVVSEKVAVMLEKHRYRRRRQKKGTMKDIEEL